MRVLLVDSHQKQAWAWNDQAQGEPERRIPKEVAYDSLPAAFLSPFYYAKWLNQQTFGISLSTFPVEKATDYALSMAVHEAFHARMESAFQFPPQEGRSRWNEYPLDTEPRYLREMIIRSLKRALQSKNPENWLAAAAYWHEQYKTRWPDDAAATHHHPRRAT